MLCKTSRKSKEKSHDTYTATNLDNSYVTFFYNFLQLSL